MWQQYLVSGGDTWRFRHLAESRIPVWDEFVPRFKATLELGVCAMILPSPWGFRWALAAVKRGSIFDHTAVGWR